MKDMPIQLKHQRLNIYLACEEMNFAWDEQDVSEFDRMWREGLDIGDIAKAFDRDTDEVALLVIDRARKGLIGKRKNGVYGRRMPEGMGT